MELQKNKTMLIRMISRMPELGTAPKTSRQTPNRKHRNMRECKSLLKTMNKSVGKIPIKSEFQENLSIKNTNFIQQNFSAFNKFNEILLATDFGQTFQNEFLLNKSYFSLFTFKIEALLTKNNVANFEGNYENLLKITKLLTEKQEILNEKRVKYILASLLSDIRLVIRNLCGNTQECENIVHIIEWGEIFTFLCEKIRNDTIWEQGFDKNKAKIIENQEKTKFEMKINEMEQNFKLEKEKLTEELETITEVLKKTIKEREDLKNELHYKLQEMCIVFILYLIDTQQKYIAADNMLNMEKSLSQLGTTLRQAEETLYEKGTVLSSFKSMIKFIRLSVFFSIQY